MVNIFGRDDSLRMLADATADMQAGRGGLVMVRGDPGMGVTALLSSHLTAMRAAGMRTYRLHVLSPHGSTMLSGGEPPEWAEPALVVVDDLHGADDATLLALDELADGLHDRPLLIVAGRHRGTASARFSRLDQIAVVHDLPPLDDNAVQAVVSELTDGEPPDSVLSQVEGAGGNPWLLAQLGQAGRAAKVTAWAADLAGSDIALLRFLALLDEASAVDELAAVAEMSPIGVLAGIERLAALGLVEEHAGLVRMRYPLVRHDLAMTSTGLRGSVARSLAGRGAPPEVVVGQLAQTPGPVDDWTEEWLADHIDQLAAWPSPAVVDLLSRVVSRLSPGDTRLLPARAALADALLRSGRLDDARRMAASSLVARPDSSIRQRLRAVLALVSLIEFDFMHAAECLNPERVDGELPGGLAVIDAQARLLAGDLDGARHAVEQATPYAELDPFVEVSLLNIRAMVCTVSRDLDGALELLDQADSLLDITVADRSQWLVARLMRATVQDLRHEPGALDTIEQVRPVATEIGGGVLAWMHTIAALAAANNGRWEQSLAEVGAAMDKPVKYGMARPLHGVAAVVLLHQGDISDARFHAELADQTVASGMAVFYEQISLIGLARVADAEGDFPRALEIVRTLMDGPIGVQQGNAVAAVGPPLVRIAVRGGDRELANRLMTEVRHHRLGESAGERGAMLYCQGMVDDDVDALLASAKIFAEADSPVGAAHAAEDAARVLASSGRKSDARELYQEAIDRYTALAATGDIQRADATFRNLGVKRGATGRRRRPAHGWESLTTAEYRVAELVAQGGTNKDIAERLIVSVRTVHSHVSRVLAKLGFSSRVEIALAFQPRPDAGGPAR